MEGRERDGEMERWRDRELERTRDQIREFAKAESGQRNRKPIIPI